MGRQAEYVVSINYNQHHQPTELTISPLNTPSKPYKVVNQDLFNFCLINPDGTFSDPFREIEIIHTPELDLIRVSSGATHQILTPPPEKPTFIPSQSYHDLYYDSNLGLLIGRSGAYDAVVNRWGEAIEVIDPRLVRRRPWGREFYKISGEHKKRIATVRKLRRRSGL